MISLENVCFEYEGKQSVLTDISFDVQSGDKLGLIGANGAGKSTLFKAMLGLIPFRGTIRIDDIQVCKDNAGIVRKMAGLVLQNSDNQMFMPDVFSDMMFAPLNYGMNRDEAEAKVDKILDQLGIRDLKYKQNHKISGGEKRMAAIATILTMEPSVILMDEPTASLDPFNRRSVINIINSLDNTMVIASHDLDMIYETCNKVALLSNGILIKTGDKDTILRDKELLETNRLELPYRFSITR